MSASLPPSCTPPDRRRDWGHDYGERAAPLPWSVKEKDDKTSGLTIYIHFAISQSTAQWLHLVFTVTLHLASSILSSHIHSQLLQFLFSHHILWFYFLNPSTICCLFAQANFCLFFPLLLLFSLLSLWNKYGSCSLKDHLMTHSL